MQADYAAGKKVYKGGLPNAQSGTLKPEGYIKRGLKQKSQRRSGIAQVALARMKNTGATPGQPLPPTKQNFNMQGLAVSPTGKLGKLK